MEGFSFLITITSIQSGRRNRAAIVRCAYELQRYVNDAEDVVIENVQMLCPPSITRRNIWSLEDLVQVVCFKGNENGETAVVYTTSMGTYKLGDLDLRRKKTCHVWYSERRLRAHIPQVSSRLQNQDEVYSYGAGR